MLRIATDTLPQTDASYVAFRVAFLDTLERYLLARQVGTLHEVQFGYLTEVPFLKSVAPQVQLQLLADCWTRHADPQPVEASLVDESVVYAACETAARLVEEEPREVRRMLENGPRRCEVAVGSGLAGELRSLHLNLSSEGDFLLISQFEDMDPEDGTRLKRKFGLEPGRLEPMFEVLGRWYASPWMMQRLEGLFDGAERERVNSALQLRHPAYE